MDALKRFEELLRTGRWVVFLNDFAHEGLGSGWLKNPENLRSDFTTSEWGRIEDYSKFFCVLPDRRWVGLVSGAAAHILTESIHLRDLRMEKQRELLKKGVAGDILHFESYHGTIVKCSQIVEPEEIRKLRRRIEDRLRKDHVLVARTAAWLNIL